MRREQWIYLGQLVRALQVEGVDGVKIGEQVAEIDMHLSDSGADPVEEFGPPGQLAKELSSRPGTRRPGWVPPLWASHLVGVLFLLILLPLISFQEWTDSSIPMTVGMLMYAVVFYAGIVWIGWRVTNRLDGRTWSKLGGWEFVLSITALAVVMASLSNLSAESVIFAAPKIPYLIGAAVLIPVLLWLLARRSNPVRFPPHAQHLQRLRRGPLAGSAPPAA